MESIVTPKPMNYLVRCPNCGQGEVVTSTFILPYCRECVDSDGSSPAMYLVRPVKTDTTKGVH